MLKGPNETQPSCRLHVMNTGRPSSVRETRRLSIVILKIQMTITSTTICSKYGFECKIIDERLTLLRPGFFFFFFFRCL